MLEIKSKLFNTYFFHKTKRQELSFLPFFYDVLFALLVQKSVDFFRRIDYLFNRHIVIKSCDKVSNIF